MKRYNLVLILASLVYSCVETPEVTSEIQNGKTPEVITQEVQDIQLYQATLYGTVVSNNGNVTSERGFYISKNEDPLTNGTKIPCGSGIGDYSGIASNLTNDTRYYYQSYAVNLDGTTHGNIVPFETQGRVWEERPSFPGRERVDATTFVIGDKLYVTCGSSDVHQSLGDTWEFSVTSNSWTHLSDFPGQKRRYAAAFTINQSAYVGTGQFMGSDFYNDFYKFENRSWNTTAITDDNMIPRRQSMGFGLNGKGYLVGGTTSDKILTDIWQFTVDGGINRWTRMKDFPKDIEGGISIYSDNEAYIGFGILTTNPDQILWKYDDSADGWVEFTQAPENIGMIYAGVILKEKIYVVNDLNRIWELNLSTKVWKAKSTMPDVFDNYRGQQCMFATNEYIYIGLNNYSRYFYRYNPLLDY